MNKRRTQQNSRWELLASGSAELSKQVEYKQLMNWLDFALAEGEAESSGRGKRDEILARGDVNPWIERYMCPVFNRCYINVPVVMSLPRKESKWPDLSWNKYISWVHLLERALRHTGNEASWLSFQLGGYGLPAICPPLAGGWGWVPRSRKRTSSSRSTPNYINSSQTILFLLIRRSHLLPYSIYTLPILLLTYLQPSGSYILLARRSVTRLQSLARLAS